MDATVEYRRDVRVVSLVGVGHGVSHFYQLVLPPLYPLLHGEGYSFTQLGLIVSVMYVASGILQPFAGILVDRIGARLLLLLGMLVMAAGTSIYAVAPSYEAMLFAAAVVGAGNSVFHPCGYSVLSATVSDSRVGRAFGLHIFGGYIGYGLAPPLMAWLGHAIGWQQAVIGVSIGGLVFVVLIAALSGDFRDSRHEAPDTARPQTSFKDSLGVLFQPPVLLCWLFFMVMAIGQIGLQTKTVAILTLPGTYAMSAEMAGFIVSAMIYAVAAGVVVGGHIADRTASHDAVIAISYGFAGVLMLTMFLFALPTVLVFGVFLVTGFAYGVAFPSRDLVVRRAAPKGATGKVFGFVYAGMDFGSMVAPVLFGWFIDSGMPLAAFLCVAGLWLAGIVMIRITTRQATDRRRAAA